MIDQDNVISSRTTAGSLTIGVGLDNLHCVRLYYPIPEVLYADCCSSFKENMRRRRLVTGKCARDSRYPASLSMVQSHNDNHRRARDLDRTVEAVTLSGETGRVETAAGGEGQPLGVLWRGGR